MSDTNYTEWKTAQLNAVEEKIESKSIALEKLRPSDPKFMEKWTELNTLRWDRLTIIDRLSNKAQKQLGMEEYRVPDVVS